MKKLVNDPRRVVREMLEGLVDAVFEAIQAVAGPRGVVLVMATELARTGGIPAEIVIVAADVALCNTVEPTHLARLPS